MSSDGEAEAKSAWYRARKAGLVVGPLERHHDRWLTLIEREPAWPTEGAPSGAHNAGTLSPMRQSG